MTLLFLTACGDESTSPELKSTDDELAELFSQSTLPGISYSLVDGAGIKSFGTSGYANLESGIKYNEDTRQSVASVSKAVLGVAVAKSIELGYFSLDTDINDLVPFEVNNPDFPEKKIKIKHLATHTSGIVDDIQFFFATYKILPNEDLGTETSKFMINTLNAQTGELPSMGEILYEYLSEDGEYYSQTNFSDYAPGEGYAYSNVGASLLAAIIELKSEMSYKEFVNKYIFSPLGMNGTSFDYPANENSNLYSKLYFNKSVSYPRYQSALYASGSLISTVNDLSKFLAEMINGYNKTNYSILTGEGYDMLFDIMYTDQVTGAVHGLFWFREGNDLFHAGNDLGTVAKIHFNTKTGKGFVFLTNSEIQFSEDAGSNLVSINNILYRLGDEVN